MRIQFIYLIISILTLNSCSNNPLDKETLTKGTIKISVDESFKPAVDACLNVFTNVNNEAKVTPTYTNETTCLNDLIKDSARCIIIGRDLTQNDLDLLKAANIDPDKRKIAYDAIALILNKNNLDTAFTKDQLEGILLGKITSWKQINPNSKLGDIRLILDQPNSSNTNYLNTKFWKNNIPKNVFAQKGNKEVVTYVETDENAIGMIGMSWISDEYDSLAQNFLKQITVAELETQPYAVKDAGKFCKPYQAAIALGAYPLIREVFLINREKGFHLGTGFAGFMGNANNKGQIILRSSGLLPSNVEANVRVVEVK